MIHRYIFFLKLWIFIFFINSFFFSTLKAQTETSHQSTFRNCQWIKSQKAGRVGFFLSALSSLGVAITKYYMDSSSSEQQMRLPVGCVPNSDTLHPHVPLQKKFSFESSLSSMTILFSKMKAPTVKHTTPTAFSSSPEVPKIVPSVQTSQHTTPQIQLEFPNQTHPNVSEQTTLHFPVDLLALSKGSIYHAIKWQEHVHNRECDFYKESSHASCSSDKKTPCMTIESKTAGFIKGRHPSFFNQHFFKKGPFFSSFIPQATITHQDQDQDQDRELIIKQNISIGPVSVGHIQFHVGFQEFGHQELQTLYKQPTPVLPDKWKQQFPSFEHVIKSDQELGIPHHIQIINISQSNRLLERTLIINKFYHFQNEDQQEDHTLSITYQTTFLKEEDFPVPLWMVRGPLKSNTNQEILNITNILRDKK